MSVEANLAALQFNRDTASAVNSFCEPLFNTFDMALFSYVRIFPNCKMLRLSNIPSLTDQYFKHSFYNDSKVYGIPKISINNISYSLLIGEPQGDFCRILYNDFKIWNFLLIYERLEDYSNCWCMGASRENSEILGVYLNHIEAFKKFIVYFKEKFLSSPDFLNPLVYITTSVDHLKKSAQTQEKDHEKFFEETKWSNLLLKPEKNILRLSKREGECLIHLVNGLTMKKMASLMDVSIRTIETHINNIKIKTKCYNKSEIIQLANKTLPFLSNY